MVRSVSRAGSSEEVKKSTAVSRHEEEPVGARDPIVVNGVSHVFRKGPADDGTVALQNVSLSVQAGEFVSLIGPSGCGKTTLLNMIAGFISPTSGRVLLNGHKVAGIQSRQVAFMFAKDNLLPWRTAAANVRLPMELHDSKPDRSTRDAHADDLLARVGLEGFGERYPYELSHGMRQRVALARTLATDSDVVLMDEPFGALDAQTRVLVQDEFSHMWDTLDKTVLMVTHDLTEAIALSDRVLVMSSRPGHIKNTYAINLPRPRIVLELPGEPEYQRLHGALWRELKDELVHGRDDELADNDPPDH